MASGHQRNAGDAAIGLRHFREEAHGIATHLPDATELRNPFGSGRFSAHRLSVAGTHKGTHAILLLASISTAPSRANIPRPAGGNFSRV
jgi:hypothetical protein